MYINADEPADFSDERWSNRRIEFLQVSGAGAQHYENLYQHALHTLIVESADGLTVENGAFNRFTNV